MRTYQKLWLAIAASDSPEGVTVKCHRNFQRTLIQAVRKEKTKANMTRKHLDMPRYGLLTSSSKPVPESKSQVAITFHLSYNGDKL